MPTDQRHFPIVEASKAWRKNMRTLVAMANETVASEYAHFGDSSEVWGYYPDDAPLKGLHPGDSRAALTPFLAHEVCILSLTYILYLYSYLLMYSCISIQPPQLLAFFLSSEHMQGFYCLDLSVVEQCPSCRITDRSSPHFQNQAKPSSLHSHW